MLQTLNDENRNKLRPDKTMNQDEIRSGSGRIGTDGNPARNLSFFLSSRFLVQGNVM